MDKEIQNKKRACEILKIDMATIIDIDSEYIETLSSKISLLESLKYLENFGFSFEDLKKIRQFLNELSLDNEMKFKNIKLRFFELLARYGKNVALEKEKETLEYLISELEKETTKKRSVITSQNSSGILLKNLLDKGLKENDIILVKRFLDTIEKNNVNLNNLEISLRSPSQFISQNIMEDNNIFKLPLPSM